MCYGVYKECGLRKDSLMLHMGKEVLWTKCKSNYKFILRGTKTQVHGNLSSLTKMVDQPRDWYCSPSNHVATKHSASWLYPISQNVIYIYTVHITSDNRTRFRYTAKEMCAVPGMSTLKLVNVTFLLVVHLKVCLSSVLERPVQKYFSGLKPTKLTKRAFSYLHENM